MQRPLVPETHAFPGDRSDLPDVLDAVCAISGQVPEDRATNQYGARPEREP
jgi:hypothetical protein